MWDITLWCNKGQGMYYLVRLRDGAYKRSLPANWGTYSVPPFFLSQIEELVKANICDRDRSVLQQLALNVHVKHSDLT